MVGKGWSRVQFGVVAVRCVPACFQQSGVLICQQSGVLNPSSILLVGFISVENQEGGKVMDFSVPFKITPVTLSSPELQIYQRFTHLTELLETDYIRVKKCCRVVYESPVWTSQACALGLVSIMRKN